MPLVYRELNRGSTSESSVGFAVDSARGEGVYILINPTKADLQNLPMELLGGVDLRPISNAGQQSQQPSHIRRYLPKRHPIYDSMVFTAITGVRGVGTKDNPQPGTVDVNLGNVQGFILWPQYEVGVEYAPASTYGNLKPDPFIKTTQATYYNYLGTTVSYNYTNEWIRYTTWAESPSGDVVTSKFGQMKFTTGSGGAPGSSSPETAAQYQGTPYQTLPDSIFKIKWQQVPLSFLTSPFSYIRNCPLGVINQSSFFDPNGDGATMFPAGSLQYMGYSYRDYTPPIPASLGSFAYVGLGSDTSRLCDIDFTFKRTTRQRFARDLPTANQVGADVNQNWIIGGFNLQPQLATPNSYYYTHSIDQTPGGDVNNKAKWFPHHNSFPFQLFFTNPDAVQPFRASMLEVLP